MSTALTMFKERLGNRAMSLPGLLITRCRKKVEGREKDKSKEEHGGNSAEQSRKRNNYRNRPEEEKMLYQKAGSEMHSFPCNCMVSPAHVCSSALLNCTGWLFSALKNKMCFFILSGFFPLFFFKCKPLKKWSIINLLTPDKEERPAIVLPPQHSQSSAPYSLPLKTHSKKDTF